jgi:hypothetical protein
MTKELPQASGDIRTLSRSSLQHCVFAMAAGIPQRPDLELGAMALIVKHHGEMGKEVYEELRADWAEEFPWLPPVETLMSR